MFGRFAEERPAGTIFPAGSTCHGGGTDEAGSRWVCCNTRQGERAQNRIAGTWPDPEGPVQGARPHLRGGDGRCLPRPGHGDRRPRCAQAVLGPPPRRALRSRGAPAIEPPAPSRRPHHRPLLDAQRPVPRDGSREGSGPGHADQAARRSRPPPGSVDGVRAPDLRGASVRPRPADRAPRRQASEHHPRRERHRARGLRNRPRARRGGTARDRRDRHPPVHGTRGFRRRPGVAAQRRVQRRGDAVDADRRPAAGLCRSDQAFQHQPRGHPRARAARSPPGWR